MKICRDRGLYNKWLLFFYFLAVGRPVSKAYIIYSGLETLEFKNLFPHWENEEEIADLMRKVRILQEAF